MSDTGSARPAVDTTAVAYGGGPDPTGWTGWIVFASFMMFMLGAFQVVQGVVVIFDEALAGLSAILNLAFIEAQPVWSVIVIAIDVLVIYAVTVHGRELRPSSV